MKSKNRAITYSLLAHIRNKGELVKGPLDIFKPLLLRTVSKLNSEGIYKGSNISEIKEFADKEYQLDFPIPVIRTILYQIAKEVNTEEITKFIIHKDDSFEISKFTFEEYEDIILNKEQEIQRIEKLYGEFRESITDEKNDSESIFKFIEKNKYNLSKYFSSQKDKNENDYTIEAQFVNFFKSTPSIYEIIKDIYLGSILACYVEYKPEINTKEVELLLDTNFIVGLLDLNTPESTHTCRTLIKIAQASGYKVSILKATINETENLLKNKAINFDKSFLQKKINPEDVFNACDRRKLTKTDLERISDNIEKELVHYKINIYHHHEKLTNEAKTTSDYERLKTVRNSNISALHDATAIVFVRKTRGKLIKDFDKVNCWFVNNSISYYGEQLKINNEFQTESIKADDLLNILWLSNPAINKQFQSEDLVNIGLSSTISLTINKNLPKSKVLKDLDENLCKYAQNEISDEDIIRIAKRITNKQLSDIENLNKLAEDNNSEEFLKRLSSEVDKQKEIEAKTARKLDIVFRALKVQTNAIVDSKRNSLIKNDELNKTKELLNEAKQELLNHKKKVFVQEKLNSWRRNSIYELITVIFFFLLFFFFILFKNDFNIDNSLKYYKDNLILNSIVSLLLLIFNGITIKSLYDKYRNHSNIANFKKSVEENYK